MALSAEKRPQFNQDIRTWAKLTKDKLAFKLASLDLESQIEVLQRARGKRKPLSDSLKSKIKEDFGQAEIVRFSFWAHGWYFDRGVGAGTPIARAGSTARVPKPWIDFILEEEVEKLGDMIMESYGDDVIDQLKIRG